MGTAELVNLNKLQLYLFYVPFIAFAGRLAYSLERFPWYLAIFREERCKLFLFSGSNIRVSTYL